MPEEYILNGHIYHETNSDEARAAIERAGDANLITTVDGNPAWVFDGICMVQGDAIDGANIPNWSGSDEYPYDH